MGRAGTADPSAARGGCARLAQEPEPNSGPVLTLRVLDAIDSSPLPGAVVWVRSNGGRTHAWEGMTDTEGLTSSCLPMLRRKGLTS